jgi:pyruvate dehydrogenase E2 component (dihydrolipoamide acetyltransferase)
MHASLIETAQFTLNSSASAESLLSWRSKYKNSPEELGLNGISMNDLVMYAAAKLLPLYPELNSTYKGGKITRYKHVHMGFAVDTPKGLMVPVVKFADQLSLQQLSSEIRRLATACRDGKAAPDELSGGTFTITNLGSFGIESFTPVVNTPEVAILGVNTIYNSVVEKDGGVGIEKRIGFSLTVDHQIVDGAPGARFLKAYTQMISDLELLMAL